MKKFFCSLFAFAILSVGTYCDTYLMWGGDVGYANMAGNGGYYTGTFFDTQFYPFDGSIGVGLDLKLRIPFIRHKVHSYLYEHYTNEEIQVTDLGVDFIVAPTLSLKLSSFTLKAFPLFAYSIHTDFDFVEVDGQVRGNVKEPYIGGGAEISWAGRIIEAFLTGSYGKLMHTKGKYFSIGLGVRCFSRIKSHREKIEEEKIAEQQALIRQQEEQERLQAEQERAQAETVAIQSGSVKKMMEFANQYGGSENIRLAIERVLSNNKNQSYKEISLFDNPYSFEKGSVYYSPSTNFGRTVSIYVYQWLSQYSCLAQVTDAPMDPENLIYDRQYFRTEIIYIEGENIKNIKGKKIDRAFLKANGVYVYNTAGGSFKIVPKFTLMLLDDSKTDFD